MASLNLFGEEGEEIKTRRQMEQHFDALMSSAYRSIRSDQSQHFGENLLKSYVLEFHNPERSELEIENLVALLADDSVATNYIADEHLVSVSGSGVRFFIDTSDTRFLIFHSGSKAQEAEDFIANLTKRHALLDRTWFNTMFLEALTYHGEFESWKTVFNSKRVFKESQLDENEDLDWDQLYLTVKTRNPREKLREIRETKIFEGMLPITGVRIKNQQDSERFAREDISYLGKFTARGNNFGGHVDTVSRFIEIYSKLVETIEDVYGLSVGAEGSMKGEPLVINFPEIELKHFQLVIQNWFEGTQPFGLWGVVNFKKDDYALIDAIDLHVGQQISFEITPSFMRVYLSKGTCGNTITRLLTNLEQHFKSSIEIHNNKISHIFQELMAHE